MPVRTTTFGIHCGRSSCGGQRLDLAGPGPTDRGQSPISERYESLRNRSPGRDAIPTVAFVAEPAGQEAVLGFGRAGQVDPTSEPSGKARFLMRDLLVSLLILAFAAPAFQLQAQSLECGADEGQCLEDSFALACSARIEAFEDNCLAWVQRVESHSLAENPRWRLIAATAYFRMAEFAESVVVAERYRERSRTINQELLAQQPSGYYANQAYIGLANLASVETEDASEVIRLTRMALQADPGNRNTMMGLARMLTRRGESGDHREAADMYRAAYIAGGSRFWYLAANASGLYDSTGQSDRAEVFRDQVKKDSGIDEFEVEVKSVSFAEDLERAAVVFDTACQRYVIAIFGSETCANGIDTLVAATRSIASPAERRAIVGVATEGMRMLTVAGDTFGDETRQRETKFGSILREWIATDVATAATFVLWAQHRESGLDEYVSALERAVELAPDNGQYRFWLANGHIQQGRHEEAINHLRIARDTIPDDVGLRPERIDEVIREAEMASDLGR